MTALIALLLLSLQIPTWNVRPRYVSVGDTVTVARRYRVPPDATPILGRLEPTTAFELLSNPDVVRSEGSLLVRYRLAFFETGTIGVPMPDLELRGVDGQSEFVFGDTAFIGVTSVLPSGDGLPPPRASIGPFSYSQQTLIPVTVLVITAFTILGVWAYLRRRVRPRPDVIEPSLPQIEVPTQQWIMAGELRTVVATVSERIREEIASALPGAGRQLSTEECLKVVTSNRPDWPSRDISETLHALDRAQYAPAVPSDIALLVDQAEDIIAAIGEPEKEANER